MIILGIDPGTAITGYGIVEVKGNKLYYLGHGCIFTDAKLPMEKNTKIYEKVSELVEIYRPNDLAVEDYF